MSFVSTTWFKWVFGTFLVLMLSVSGYGYYNVAYSVCRIPVYYDIGVIDPAFHLTTEEARAAISDAESIWEDATGKNLFSYKKGGSLKINFVYDSRQKVTTEARKAKEALDAKAKVNKDIQKKYEDMRTAYLGVKKTYDTNVKNYEARLASYNTEVATWNTKGGAPNSVYARLAETKKTLDTEHQALNKTADSLNALAKKLNTLGDQGNDVVNAYNKDVDRFNAKYGKRDEFTEGDYQNGRINIYQFDDLKELRLVLAHELGHAISLGHVSDAASIMHYMMGGQSPTTTPTEVDMAEFHRVCGTR